MVNLCNPGVLANRGVSTGREKRRSLPFKSFVAVMSDEGKDSTPDVAQLFQRIGTEVL